MDRYLLAGDVQDNAGDVENATWFHIGEALPPNPGSPGIAVIAYMGVEAPPSGSMGSPVRALSKTPSRDSRKAEYCAAVLQVDTTHSQRPAPLT